MTRQREVLLVAIDAGLRGIESDHRRRRGGGGSQRHDRRQAPSECRAAVRPRVRADEPSGVVSTPSATRLARPSSDSAPSAGFASRSVSPGKNASPTRRLWSRAVAPETVRSRPRPTERWRPPPRGRRGSANETPASMHVARTTPRTVRTAARRTAVPHRRRRARGGLVGHVRRRKQRVVDRVQVPARGPDVGVVGSMRSFGSPSVESGSGYSRTTAWRTRSAASEPSANSGLRSARNGSSRPTR